LPTLATLATCEADRQAHPHLNISQVISYRDIAAILMETLRTYDLNPKPASKYRKTFPRL